MARRYFGVTIPLLHLVSQVSCLINPTAFRSSSSFLMAATTPSPEHNTGSLTIGPSDLRALVQEASRQNGLDLQGIVWLEHLNLVVGCMEAAKKFYIDFLGLSVDADSPKHFNLGQQQFHLAATDDPPQRICGSICLTVPSLRNIQQRAQVAQKDLKNTLFSICDNNDVVPEMKDKVMTVTCPWGNTFHLFDISIDDDFPMSNSTELQLSPHKMVNLHLEGGVYGSHRMAVRGGPGIRAVEIACKKGTAAAIAQFYETFLGCTVKKVGESIEAIAVSVGPGVHLLFVESELVRSEDFAKMKGVHACIYIAEFKNMYAILQDKGLIWTNPRFTHLDSCDTWEEALASRTFRFKNIIDVSTGEKVLELEHETRPMKHGQYMKVPKYIPN